MSSEWDQESENWIAWARSPGFDAYWYYRDAFFDATLPAVRAAPWKSAVERVG